MSAPGTQPTSYLAMCAIYKDEAPFLREWIEFHRLVGFERFFLYDNNSTDSHREVLAPYVEDGIAEVAEWPQFPAQGKAYRHCLQTHWGECRWIAFLDVDEFLFSPTGRPVPEVLREFEEFPGVVVNRATFGTSGHQAPVQGLITESYTRRAQDQSDVNKFVKSVVDPYRAAGCVNDQNPHCFVYSEGFAVNEQRKPIDAWPFGRSEPISFSLLKINHYWTKSEQEWSAKADMPMASNARMRGKEVGEDLNEVEDLEIAAYLPRLREALEGVEARSPTPASPV
jgi:hypothetical protein